MIRDEMLDQCMELFRKMYRDGKMDFIDRGLNVKTTIAQRVSDLAPARWGKVCVEIEKSSAECSYIVRFAFGGLIHTKRGQRVRFGLVLPQIAIHDGC